MHKQPIILPVLSGGSQENDVTFTQEQLDEAVRKAVAEAKPDEKVVERKPADYDELKAQAEEFKRLKQADKSELDVAKERVAELEREAETLKSQSANERKRGLLAAAARDANFHDPDAAASLINGDTFKGVESLDDAKAVVTKLSESKTWLVAPKEPVREGVEKILKDGQVVEPKDGDKATTPGIGTLEQAYAENSPKT